VFGYDANRMQLTSQKAGTVSPYTNRMNLTYSYAATAGQMGSGSTAGNAGQLMAVSGTINGTTESAAYTYDNLGRLVTSNQTSNGSSAQRRFAYDRWGNRTGMWDATSGGTQIQSISLVQSGGVPNNQIASVTSGGTVNYTYDAAGNVTNDGVHSYSYDSENRLVSVDGGSTASYAYDHQNRRYKKTVGSIVTHYVWRSYEVIAEHNGNSGAVVADYVLAASKMIGKVAVGSFSYLLSDRLSTRLHLDTSGAVVGRQAHLPFGEDFGESGIQDKHHLTSYERDSEGGTDYALNRQYAQSVAGFMRPDPLRKSCYRRNPQKWNGYSYIENNPVNGQDRLGLEPFIGSNDGWSYWHRVFSVLFAALAGEFELGHHGKLLDGGGGDAGEGEDCGECCELAWEMAWDTFIMDLNLSKRASELAFECYQKCSLSPGGFVVCFSSCLVAKQVGAQEKIKRAAADFFQRLGTEGRICHDNIPDCWCAWM